MIPAWIPPFVMGLFIGGSLGVLIMACLACSARAEEKVLDQKYRRG